MVCTSESRSTSSIATGDLVLRVHGPSHDGQIIHLQSAKCTVGAGAHCTLRLRGARISSLHCLIIRGSEQTVVRRWSADTRLNGRRFDDAPLVAGDRLTIGPVELEVLQSGTPTPPDDEATWTPAEAAAQLQRQLDQVAEQRRALEFEQRQCEEERAKAKQVLADQESTASAAAAESAVQLQRQLDQLAEQRRALKLEQRQCEEERAKAKQVLAAQESVASEAAAESAVQLQRQLDQLTEQRRTLELEQRQWNEERTEAKLVLANQTHELAALRQEVARQQDIVQNRGMEAQRRLDAEEQRLNALAAEVHAQEQALAKDRNECQMTQSELASRQKALDEDRRRWESEQAQLSARAAQQLEQLEKRLAEIDSQRQILAAENSQWEQRRAESERKLDARTKRLEADAADLETQRQKLAARIDEVESLAKRALETQPSDEDGDVAASTSEDAPSEPATAPSREMPASLADVLRRYGASSLLEEESEAQLPRSNEVETLPTRQPEASRLDSVRPARDTKASGDHEEESIDDYMSRLLARVRGEGDGQPSPVAQPETTKARVAPTPPPVEPTEQQEPNTPVCQDTTAMLPRAAAPEKHADMSAMRELANLSAQTAISKHARLQMAVNSRLKLVVTITALGAGAALLGMWGWLNASSSALYAAEVSFLVAILWGAQYVIITGRLILSKFSRRASLQKISQQSSDASTGHRPESG